MNFFPLSQQNDMYPLHAKKLEISRSPVPVPISLGRKRGSGSVGPLERVQLLRFPGRERRYPGPWLMVRPKEDMVLRVESNPPSGFSFPG